MHKTISIILYFNSTYLFLDLVLTRTYHIMWKRSTENKHSCSSSNFSGKLTNNLPLSTSCFTHLLTYYKLVFIDVFYKLRNFSYITSLLRGSLFFNYNWLLNLNSFFRMYWGWLNIILFYSVTIIFFNLFSNVKPSWHS